MKNEYPMVSVVIPIYNVEKYLKNCINSILNQSFKDFEIILVNDGSTDKSIEICREYQKVDKRIKVLDKENSGPSSAKNLGLRYSSGKYICFIDSDDEMKHNYLEIFINKAEKYDCDIICSSYMTNDKKIINANFKANTVLSGRNLILSNSNVSTSNDLCFSWRYFYKLKNIKKHNIKFSEEIFIGEDTLFNLENLLLSDRTMFIDIPTYIYNVQNNNSLMKTKYKPYLENSLIKQYEKRIYLSNKYKLMNNKEYKNNLANYYINSIYIMLINNLKNSETTNFKNEVKRISNNKMFRESTKNLGLKYKCSNFKEYIFYLSLKFKIYPILLKVVKN